MIDRRGQASVEGLALWAVVAAGAAAAAAAIASSSLPAAIVDAVRSAIVGAPSDRGTEVLDGALKPGGPSLLLVRTRLRLRLGEVAATELLRAAVEQVVNGSERQQGSLDVTALVGGKNPHIRLIATATGPLRLVGIASDEALPDPIGISLSPTTVVGGVIAASVHASGHGRVVEVVGASLREGTAIAGHAWTAVGIVSDMIVTAAGLPPGARAGDATLCRPVDIRWVAYGRPYRRPTAEGHELVIVRNGVVVARYVPAVEGPCT